jgi:hypothetical protein
MLKLVVEIWQFLESFLGIQNPPPFASLPFISPPFHLTSSHVVLKMKQIKSHRCRGKVPWLFGEGTTSAMAIVVNPIN